MAKKRKSRKKVVGLMTVQRNRIRGMIAASKSKGVVLPTKSKNDAKVSGIAEKARDFQRSLAAILIASRESLQTSQFEEFLSWVELQTTSQAAPLKSFGILRSELVQEVLASHPLPLQKEVLWIVLRLVQQKDLLSNFLEEKDQLETLYWDGDWNKIKAQLELIETKFGRTLWGLEANITLKQEFVGLEEQKKIVNLERKLSPRSLAAYLAYNYSARNEPTAVLSRHYEEVSTRIDRLGVTSMLKSFLRYSLLNQEILSEKEASEVLQVAQSLSEIDLYEILIGICQLLAVSELDPAIGMALSRGLERLCCIGDERVAPLLRVLKGGGQETIHRQESAAFAVAPLKEALLKLKSNPRDVDTAIQIAARLNTVRKPIPETNSGFRWKIVLRKISTALQFGPDYDRDIDAVERYFCNHRFFTTSMVCANLLKAEMSVLAEEAVSYLQRAAVRKTLDSHHYMSGIIGRRMMLNTSAFNGKERPRWAIVLEILWDLQEAISNGKMEMVVPQLAHLYLNNIVPLSVLPLRSGIGVAKWRQLKRYSDQLVLLIALHLCWRTTDSDLAASNLRFAFEEFLDAHNVKSPSEITTHRDKFKLNELIYFLNNICVVNVMDMSVRISSSREAEIERQHVCSVLCELNPSNRTNYEAEIVGIVHMLSLQEGRTVVDSSRVHVDTEAIRAWALRELESSFRRYTALVKAGVGMAENFDDLMRNIRTANTTQQQYMEIPESEADNVLVEMMIDILDRFLFDPHHGLDSYLSRRVRHHSMTGYLRGPVEEEKLITSRNTKTTRYAENLYWTGALGSHTAGEKILIARCFEEFSEEFDRTVLHLKDQLFHVKSDSHPKGLFKISIGAPMVHLARSAVQTDMSLDSFCTVCFSLFWGSLDGSLQDAQHYLRNNTKHELSTTFHHLKSSLKKAVSDRSRYNDASVAIGKAAANVQGGIDKMAEWFTRQEIQQTNIQYTIEKVLDIAVESALASYRPFSPLITKEVTCDYQVRAGDLIVVAEIILTALGNVKAYGGIGKQPYVKISANCSEDEEVLLLRVENDVATSALSTEARTRVNSIREQIKDGSYVDKIRKEGGSGLMKISGTASQSKNGRMTFDFTDENRFFIEVKLSFIRENVETENIAVGRLVG